MRATNRGGSGIWTDIDIAEAYKHLPKVGEYAYYYDYDEDRDLAIVRRGIVESACFSERSKFPHKEDTDYMFCIYIKLKGISNEFNIFFSDMEDVRDSDIFACIEDLQTSLKWQRISNIQYAYDQLDTPLNFELEEEVKPTYFY